MAAPTTTKYYGITPPISTNGPTARQEELTASLKAEMVQRGAYETEEESKLREVVLGRVAALVRKFVYSVSVQRGHSEAAAHAAGGKIFTFGSYRLGVHGPGSDIDTLCVVPKHITRDDFFIYFEPMLREFEGATEVAGVPEAFVPIITANINGIAIDFLFARLALSVIPDDLELKDDNILKNLDERCVRSLNGSRVTDQILRLVPDVAVFREALRCIKIWAQRRAIYSNVNGFLGGVAWAMLVARICQLYPNLNAGAIVGRFFAIMHQWEWPAPVLLKPIEDGPLQVRVWNPKLYPSDRAHRMPIITPAYPAMCATHNVTLSTHTIMIQELKRASEVVGRISDGKSEWSELFTKHDFFHKYKYYLQVIASTGDADIQLKWAGTVESRLRQLVMKLETVEGLAIAHPFVKGFDQVLYCRNEKELDDVAQGDISPIVAKQTPQDIANEPAGRAVHTATFYIGLGLAPKQTGSVGNRRLDISRPTSEFTMMVKSWEHFDKGTMSIVVRHIKSSALPDNVFDPGERESVPKSLKRAKSKASPNGDSTPVPNKRLRYVVHSPAQKAASFTTIAAYVVTSFRPVTLAVHRSASDIHQQASASSTPTPQVATTESGSASATQQIAAALQSPPPLSSNNPATVDNMMMKPSPANPFGNGNKQQQQPTAYVAS